MAGCSHLTLALSPSLAFSGHGQVGSVDRVAHVRARESKPPFDQRLGIFALFGEARSQCLTPVNVRIVPSEDHQDASDLLPFWNAVSFTRGFTGALDGKVTQPETDPKFT